MSTSRRTTRRMRSSAPSILNKASETPGRDQSTKADQLQCSARPPAVGVSEFFTSLHPPSVDESAPFAPGAFAPFVGTSIGIWSRVRREDRAAPLLRPMRLSRGRGFNGEDTDRVKTGILDRLDSRREDQVARTLRNAHVEMAGGNVDWSTFVGNPGDPVGLPDSGDHPVQGVCPAEDEPEAGERRTAGRARVSGRTPRWARGNWGARRSRDIDPRRPYRSAESEVAWIWKPTGYYSMTGPLD